MAGVLNLMTHLLWHLVSVSAFVAGWDVSSLSWLQCLCSIYPTIPAVELHPDTWDMCIVFLHCSLWKSKRKSLSFIMHVTGCWLNDRLFVTWQWSGCIHIKLCYTGKQQETNSQSLVLQQYYIKNLRCGQTVPHITGVGNYCDKHFEIQIS